MSGSRTHTTSEQHATTKGAKVNAEQHGRTPSQSTGIIATLRAFFRTEGAGAPATDADGMSAPSFVSSSDSAAATTRAGRGDAAARAAGMASVAASDARTQGGPIAPLLVRLRTWQRAVCVAASVVAVLGGAAFLAVAPAQAASPWWHVTSGARPGVIDPSHGKPEIPGIPGEPEIQEIVIPLFEHEGHAEQGVLVVQAGGASAEMFTEPLGAELEPGLLVLNEANLQQVLERPSGYGAGNVTVEEETVEENAEKILKFKVKTNLGVAALTVSGYVGFGYGTIEPTASITQAGTPGTPGTPEVPDGEIYVTVENLGDQALTGSNVPVEITDHLPPSLEAVGIAATKPNIEGEFLRRLKIPCELATLTCTFETELAPIAALEMRIAVNVVPGGSTVGLENEAQVSGGEGFSCSQVGAGGKFGDVACMDAGGTETFERTPTGAVPPATLRKAIRVGSGPTPFGVETYELQNEEEGGGPSNLAGSHPFQSTTTINLNQTADGRPVENTTHKPSVNPVALPKDLHFEWPPGMIGNPNAVATCSTAQFFKSIASGGANACPPQSAVGVATVTVNEPSTAEVAQIPVPLFNLEPKIGEPARFGFNVVIANTPVVIDTSLRSDGDYGVTVETDNITQTAALLASSVTVWGSPADPRHNNQRGWGCLYQSEGSNQTELPACSATATGNGELHPAFLSLPTSCQGGQVSSVLGDTWVNPLAVSAFPTFASFAFPTFEGCNQLGFGPKVTLEPTVKSAATSSGLDFNLNFANEGLESSTGRAESQVKKVTVALPQGVTTNPSVANGLTGCSLAQYEAEEIGNQMCPESSKIGEVEIQSPLVKPTVDGSIYVAKQGDNPAHNLLSIYMVAKNPELGVLVRSAGAVTPNQQTGQLSTTFDELPQLPFSHFHLSFRSGSRAPLITPGLCGKYTTQADLYPYSNPNVPVHREATFEVNAGANGQACATNESQLPNKPALEAGTVSPIAGAYSPFVFKVSREDGSQVLRSIEATLPEGLLGKLAGVTECSNAQIAAAEARSGEGQGAAELASPSCPASSQVGTVNVGTGAGPQPYYVGGKAYLAGPYKGAPLSLAIITPAVVGPFDLGTIVVRTALYVNERTTQITAKSGPIPTIVHGLPTVVRSISLNMNRPDFTLNPTSCDPKQINGSATSTLGGVAPLQSRFQVGACGALGFKPGLKLSLTGQTKRAGHPALKAVLTYPKGSYANIASAQVSLPGSEFLDQGNLNLVCKQADLKAGTCPKKAIYGKVKAWSPLLDKPLQGNVYLGVGFGYKLPALVAELNGQIRVLLVGKVDTDKQKGIRNTFLAVPDAAVSRFELSLKGGKKYGLLENSVNICKQTQKAEAAFTAQNGKVEELKPTIANSCGKGKGKGGKPKNSAGKSKGGR
jgi:hypothetical protein